MGFERLYKNLIDIIKEEQAKLGFRREAIRLYYPLSKKERFCFHIPEEGSSYVHDNTKPNEFIKELVELVGQHGCKIEDIIALFKEHNKDIVVEEINNGEFDYLIRFPKENEDPYYYCFHNEGCHIIYHRFLPADYEDFDF